MSGGGATSPGLDGTGWVGDDLYLLAHNDVTGKPYVQPRPLGLGLAGGLLAELVLAGAVSLGRDEVVAAGHRAPPICLPDGPQMRPMMRASGPEGGG